MISDGLPRPLCGLAMTLSNSFSHRELRFIGVKQSITIYLKVNI